MTASFDKSHFLNRVLSWLKFNQRVLDGVFGPSMPLLERLKLITFVSSNLDGFFEVCVAGLKQQIEIGQVGRSVNGRPATNPAASAKWWTTSMPAGPHAAGH